MFSIIIPTKNEEEYLPILLESIKQQSVQPCEVIVADAHSTDQTSEIALRFGALMVDGGMPAVGRNRGATLARGDVLIFLDADVVLTERDMLERALGEMMERKLDLATCDVMPISDSWVDHAMHRAYNHYVRICGAVMPHAPGFCLLVRKEMHEAIGGFDESIVFCEDHDYAVRLARVGRFGFLHSVKIPVSIRRMDRDGRFTIAVKFALAEAHILTIGPIRHGLFHYTFGHRRRQK